MFAGLSHQPFDFPPGLLTVALSSRHPLRLQQTGPGEHCLNQCHGEIQIVARAAHVAVKLALL